jgi:hypothetical protein
LYFEIRHPIDAIGQFRKHIDVFKNRTGPPDFAFEHSAWMSKQFQLFGDLFDDTIKKGTLTAIQTQHPGFYYHPAANHATQRRNHQKELTALLAAQKPTDSKSLEPHLEFYGQRPWRQQAVEILDQQKEKDGILCLFELESKEDHVVGVFYFQQTNGKF